MSICLPACDYNLSLGCIEGGGKSKVEKETKCKQLVRE